ncbi:hypothetical protein OKA04_00720 [Luteolibacter flavescens]|uniref:Integron gene cassette protein n=1 Tax=Luteolibacter flavescens TaxID=1859460 RepID=A0ABT3FI37_9BACT|nr:hypothetical protein [Luteolibacter flavescens]MCW1883231.1 hypothetical protein [Luteolibacter flavescens]
MSENHGPFHRLGEPGGPGCPVGILPIAVSDAQGGQVSGSLLDAGTESTEIELLRTIAARFGVKWGRDDLGWWAVVKEVETPTWSVWRQDDHGNSFLVEANLTKSQAERLQVEFEERGHKQTYWAVDEVSSGVAQGVS